MTTKVSSLVCSMLFLAFDEHPNPNVLFTGQEIFSLTHTKKSNASAKAGLTETQALDPKVLESPDQPPQNIYYNTLHISKMTQEEDWHVWFRVGSQIIRRLWRMKADAALNEGYVPVQTEETVQEQQ